MTTEGPVFSMALVIKDSCADLLINGWGITFDGNKIPIVIADESNKFFWMNLFNFKFLISSNTLDITQKCNNTITTKT
mgnify:CR=1 FL=1